MRKILGRAAVLGGAGVASAVLCATAAFAGVSPHTVNTTNGEAGAYAFGARFQRIATTVTTSTTQEGMGAVTVAPQNVKFPLTSAEAEGPSPSGPYGGAAGIQLCDNNTGGAAQLGLLYDSNTQAFFVAYGAGVFPANTATGDPCVGDGLFTTLNASGTFGTALTSIPVGDQIRLVIQYVRNGFYHAIRFQAEDLTSGVSLWSHDVPASATGSYWPQFWEAGAGVQQDPTTVSAPAVNPLATFSPVIVRDYAGEYGWLTNKFWTAVNVDSQAQAGYPPLAVGTANRGTVTVDVGSPTGS